ncbi:MAG: hypothetical protein MK086_03700 [Flavobacteriales bacterium]|nr:hypothetical protein [Flavobacteriales bacterium]
MKIVHLSFILFLSGVINTVQSSSTTMIGVYQGKDLYVKNPFSSDGVGFCVFEVYVNGELTSDEINSSAFAIDFSILGINKGEEIEITINHKEGCGPMVLNPEAIEPHSTFEIQTIEIEHNILRWSTINESGSLPFIIEQFKWNKWVEVAEVKGAGTPKKNEYSFKLLPYSGENKVRIKQVDYTDVARYSEAKIYDPGVSRVSFFPAKPESAITFSRETQFEIFDKFGILITKGSGKSVDVSGLKSGEKYYLNFDSSFGQTFTKK